MWLPILVVYSPSQKYLFLDQFEAEYTFIFLKKNEAPDYTTITISV